MPISVQDKLGNYKTAEKNTFSRKFGHAIHPVDPYVTGYFYVFFELPTLVWDVINAKFKGAAASSLLYKDDPIENEKAATPPNLESLLTATCTGVTTVPGGTLNKVELTGQGGVKYSVAGHVDYTSEFGCKFTELTGLPIFKIFSAWSNMIRQHNIGTSMLGDNYQFVGGKYTKANYSGRAYYCTVKPDGHTPEFYACYEGLFPMKDPQDLFQSDVTSVDKVEIDMTFNVDYIWQEQWVYDACLKKIGSTMASRDEIINYGGSNYTSKTTSNASTLAGAGTLTSIPSSDQLASLLN